MDPLGIEPKHHNSWDCDSYPLSWRSFIYWKFVINFNVEYRIWTYNLHIRSVLLYPIELIQLNRKLHQCERLELSNARQQFHHALGIEPSHLRMLNTGIEPVTSCLQGKRSTNWANSAWTRWVTFSQYNEQKCFYSPILRA